MTSAGAGLCWEKKVPASIRDHGENVFYFEYSQKILMVKNIYKMGATCRFWHAPCAPSVSF